MKIGVITINSVNYGNRLQNYAVNALLHRLNATTENIYIDGYSVYTRNGIKRMIKKFVPLSILRKFRKKNNINPLEARKQKIFDVFSDKYMSNQWIKPNYEGDIKRKLLKQKFDFYVTGSDQVWNPDFAGGDYYFLNFAEPKQKIAISASIGYDSLPEDVCQKYKEHWNNMRYISVREESAADIIEKESGTRPDVFLDPTMMLNRQEWEQIVTEPKFKVPKKYVVCLFLGDVPVTLRAVCEETLGLEVVSLNDKNYPEYYLADPSEFISLIKNAELVLTDSFHCTVFSIIFRRKFWIFKRQEANVKNMFTRLESLLSKLNLMDRICECEREIHLCEIGDERFDEVERIISKERIRVERIIGEIINE